jgi:hypothetical protein
MGVLAEGRVDNFVRPAAPAGPHRGGSANSLPPAAGKRVAAAVKAEVGESGPLQKLKARADLFHYRRGDCLLSFREGHGSDEGKYFGRRHAGDIGNRAPGYFHRQCQSVEPCAAAGAAGHIAAELREVLTPGVFLFPPSTLEQQAGEARKTAAAG